jgi:hypothetical protein
VRKGGGGEEEGVEIVGNEKAMRKSEKEINCMRGGRIECVAKKKDRMK